jgi:4-diphosphocytidyl-2-C-methyl-D-erythritol kinase
MTGWSTHWPAPAKINRFLHITGQRPDGYHRLQTLFQFIEPVDQLDFRVTADGNIARTGGLAGLPAADDLVVKAARVLQREARVTAGARIHLQKRIPTGGGLGGGSSDAATTLVALDHLWGTHLGEARLQALAIGLGADVPVFIHGHAAWAEGVGDVLTPVAVDRPWLVVVDPGVPVSTRAVFTDPKLTRHGAHITIRGFESGLGRNDCESAVRRRFPEIGAALDSLGAYSPGMLTGTGGCLFAGFETQEAAQRAAAGVEALGDVWVCRPWNQSPLLDRLQAEEGH